MDNMLNGHHMTLSGPQLLAPRDAKSKVGCKGHCLFNLFDPGPLTQAIF
jgi:hypothetical protein